MSSIRVNWQTASTAADAYGTYRQELSSAIGSVRSIRSYRCMSGGSFNSVYQALDRVVRQMEEEKDALRNLGDGLSEVLKNYQKYEGNVAAQIVGNALEEERVQTASGNGETASDSNILSDLLSKLGIVGSAAVAVEKITKDWNVPKTVVDTGNTLLKFVGKNAAKVVYKDTDTSWAEYLLGLTKTSSGYTSLTLPERFLSELGLIKPTTASDAIRLGTKWGGFILTGLSNFFENQQEFAGQEGSTGRMIAETAIETGADILIGSAVSAVVTHLAAAAVAGGLIAAGPAVVVGGAVTVGVVWGINALSEHFTGKDLAENVSDAVCDGAEIVADKAKELAGNVKNAFQSFVQWGQACFA